MDSVLFADDTSFVSFEWQSKWKWKSFSKIGGFCFCEFYDITYKNLHGNYIVPKEVSVL